MTFANPLYSAITRQFFDLLASNAQQSFIDRCKELHYKDGKNSESGDELTNVDEESCPKEMIKNFEEDVQWGSDEKVFCETMSDSEKIIIIKQKKAEKSHLIQLNNERQLMESVKDLLPEKASDIKALLKKDRSLFREADMLFHAFYENGTDHCK